MTQSVKFMKLKLIANENCQNMVGVGIVRKAREISKKSNTCLKTV